jgi:phage terminase small subunit
MKDLSTKKMIRDKEHRTTAFVQAYITNGFKTREAALSAGYSKNTNMAHLLDDPRVMTKLKDEFKKRTLAHEITATRVIEELGYIAFLDIGELFNDNGLPKLLSEIPEGSRRAIASIGVKTLFQDKDTPKSTIVSLVTNSKMDALKSLAKHFGMFVEKVEVKDVTLAGLISDARKREQSRIENSEFMQ